VTLRTRLVLALGYVLLLAIVAFGVPLAINLSARVNAEVRTQARAQADLVAATAADLLGPASRPELATLARTGAASIRGRILITDARGIVLADSNGPTEIGTSYASRLEVRAALDGRPVQVQRYSRTLEAQILATAAPIIHEGRPAGAVRVTQGVASVQSAVRRAELGLVLIAAIVLALGLAAGSIIARQIAGPVQRLERVARRVAGGDLAARAELEGSREQRSLASSFNEMTERISRLLDGQRQFVADASHQLRTPLTGLRLRLEEARAEVGRAGAERELEAGIAEVDRLAATVNELLVLSRAGERGVEGAWVDLHDVAAVTTERWRRHARERGITLEHRRASPLPGGVWAARGDLERVLDALLENAIQYSPAHSTVDVSSFPERIEVSDRGPGIDEEERELVFERFRRGRAGREGPPGSGLGLATARELARAWDGAVRVDARDGGGTTVSLLLPPSPGPSASPSSPGGLPALNPAARSLPGR
jgi:two-component system, OmpR family, sensor kinase